MSEGEPVGPVVAPHPDQRARRPRRPRWLAMAAIVLVVPCLRGADLLYQPDRGRVLTSTAPPVIVQRPPSTIVKGPPVTDGVAEILARRPAIPPLPALTPDSATDATPEIVELARGLRGDPRLMYELVRNTIEYVPMYGSAKGATMTWVDRRGNDFDQTSLLIALLRASGYGATYIYGRIELTGPQVVSWLGVPDDANVVAEVLWNGGIPSDVWMNGTGGVTKVQLDHVWAKATIGGTDYVFDPSFKSHTVVNGIDLGSAMGYDRAAFLARATQGMTSDATFVKNVNRANIRADLTSFATSLASHITSTGSGMTLAQVVGGQSIVAQRHAPYETTLPHEIARTYTWTTIPDAYQTTLRIQHLGLDVTLRTVDFYGKRFTLAYSGGSPSYIPVLVLDGSQIAYGNPATTFFNPCELTINHPYAGSGGTYGDDSATVYPGAGGIYYFSSSWGGTGRQAIEKRRRALDDYMAQGLGNTSEPVLGETLAMIGLSWMAQTTRAAELGDRVDGTVTILHHELGIVGQMPGQSAFMDMPMALGTVTSKTRDAAEDLARQLVRSGVNSGFEWAAIDQMQPNSAVSTVKLLDQASSLGYKIFDTTSATWSGTGGVRAQLVGYDGSALATLDAYIGAGYRVILPERGNLQDDQYHGVGFVVVGSGGSSIANMIYGSLYGGNGNHIGIASGAEAARSMKRLDDSKNNSKSSDPVDLVTGSLTLEATDLDLGSGFIPFGLTFSRSYSSAARLASGSLGPGWSHSWGLSASAGSDGFRAMGDATPIDAAATIAALHVASDLLTVGLLKERVVMATLVQRFAMDNLIDNMLNVSVPGETIQFLKAASGTYNPPPGKWAQLVRGSGSSATVTTRYGEVITFNTDGKLASWKDPNGNTVSLAYDASKRLQSVTNGMGKTLTLVHDATGRVSSLSDGTGRSVTYGYDTAGLLTSVADPLGHTTRYEYDARSRLTKVYRPSSPATPLAANTYDQLDRVITQTNAGGGVYTYYYGGQRVEEVDPLGHSNVRTFSERGRTVSWVDAVGNETTYAYDSQDRLVRVTLPEGGGSENGYDARHNRVLKRWLPKPASPESPVEEHATFDPATNRLTSSTDGTGLTLTYVYDTKGNLLRKDYPTGGGPPRTVLFTVNARGQVASQTDEAGFVTTFTYDPSTAELTSQTLDPGGLSRTRTMVRNARGDVIGITDPLGHTTTIELDANRRPTKETAPAPFSFERRFAYDADGNRTEVRRQTGDAGHPWQIFTTTYTLDGLPQSETDPLGHTTTYQVDARRQLWKTVDPLGRTTELQYDAAGRPRKTINPLGVVTEERTYTPDGQVAAVKDALGNVTSYGYNGHNRRSRVTEPGGRVTSTFYDGAGNMDQVTRQVDALGGVTTFTYDAAGRVTRVTSPDGTRADTTYDPRGFVLSETDALGHVTSFTYDAAGNRTSKTNHEGKTWLFDHDAAGQLERVTNPDGGTRSYTFDALGRAATATDEAGRMSQTGYNALSLPITTTAPDGSVTAFGYDLAGRLVTTTDPLGHTWMSSFDAAGQPITTTDPDGRVETRVFDAAGQVVQRTARDGQITTYAYSPRGELLTATLPGGEGTVTWAFDQAGNLLSVHDASGTVAMTYDLLNRKTSVTDVFGNALAYTYTPGGRLASVTYPGNHTVTYTHDAAGRLATLADWLGGITTYQYDTRNRLARVELPNGTRRLLAFDDNNRLTSLRHEQGDAGLLLGYQLTYDPSGAITSRTKSTVGAVGAPGLEDVSFTHDALNRVSSMTQGGVTRAFTFDPRGNLASWQQGSTTTSFTFDSRNRLAGTDLGGAFTSHLFDGRDERTATTRYGTQSRRLADNGQVYCRLDSANQVLAYQIFDGGLLYTIDAAGHRFVFHSDERGSVEGISDASENLVQSYDYAPFGQLTAISGSLANGHRFTGRHGSETDEDGLIHMGARFFDPAVSRFLSEDPVGLGEGTNLYAYSRNDPINMIDPSGLRPWGVGRDPILDRFQEPGDGRCLPGQVLDFLQRINHEARNVNVAPDYFTASGSFSFLGFNKGVGITIDRYGRVYISTVVIGLDNNASQLRTSAKVTKVLSFSGSVVGGYLVGPKVKRGGGEATKEELEDFLIGEAQNISVGAGPYGGTTWTSSERSVEVGAGGGYGYNTSKTWLLFGDRAIRGSSDYIPNTELWAADEYTTGTSGEQHLSTLGTLGEFFSELLGTKVPDTRHGYLGGQPRYFEKDPNDPSVYNVYDSSSKGIKYPSVNVNSVDRYY